LGELDLEEEPHPLLLGDVLVFPEERLGELLGVVPDFPPELDEEEDEEERLPLPQEEPPLPDEERLEPPEKLPLRLALPLPPLVPRANKSAERLMRIVPMQSSRNMAFIGTSLLCNYPRQQQAYRN
jgi:hypothetical protein